jgi:hypothetical protein
MITFNELMVLLLGLLAGAPYDAAFVAVPVAAGGAWRRMRESAAG